MPRIEYAVIETDEINDFETRVNEAIQLGWLPLGGVNMVRNDPQQDSGFYKGGDRYDIWYSQAMTRRRWRRFTGRLNPELRWNEHNG